MALVTENDIWNFLMDKPEGNLLLGEFEFGEEDLKNAMESLVSKWNETRPHVGTYTIETFPYKYNYTLGVSAQLLRSAAIRFGRNELNYSTQGGSVDDQNKAPMYIKLAAELSGEFNEWMRSEKAAINIAAIGGYV